MPAALPFESRAAKINKDIEDEIKRLRAQDYELPERDAALVQSFVRKIEGTYDVSRAKKDTDSAIDLLYIAYNTTPQVLDTLRDDIVKIMDKLVVAQQQSDRTMKSAMRVATEIAGQLGDVFPDWPEKKERGQSVEITTFVVEALLPLATQIKEQALGVKKALQAIAATYDAIIEDTKVATSKSEKALGKQLELQAILRKEADEANAKRAALESLVTDLTKMVADFEKKAHEYGTRAQTAEERAFIMSIVRIAAQMISAAIPAIAMAVAGPAPMVAASTLNTVNRVVGGKADDKPGDNSNEVIATQKAAAEKGVELQASKDRVVALKKDVQVLEGERDKLLAAEAEKARGSNAAVPAGKTDAAEPKPPKDNTAATVTPPASPPPAPPVVTPAPPAAAPTASPAAAPPAVSEGVKALEQRVVDKKAELDKEEKEATRIAAALAGLNASLKVLDKNLGEMTDQQQKEASGLREMQMKMLDKATEYERERSTQSAELAKINALLKGNRNEQETLHLSVKSMNLSIASLKRTKEIVVEIAFFFQTFAEFMGAVADESTAQIKRCEATKPGTELAKLRVKALIQTTDEFFIKQTAEWHAVWFVSDKFSSCFEDGWSKLNKLSGSYITGEELTAYMQKASSKLLEIASEREAAAKQKIAELDGYRELLASAAA